MQKTKNVSNKKTFSILKNFSKPSVTICVTIALIISSVLLFQVIITQQKYIIISLNSKIDKTLTERETLEMEKSRLSSKERLRDLATNKLNMTQIEDIEDSIKAQMLE